VLSFIDQHRALVLRHARAIVRTQGDKTAVEDVACEMELVLEQMVEKGLDLEKISSPDQFLRAIARHALGRAKRRRRLIEQLAAGDDLGALSKDLEALDADLPTLSLEPSPEGTEARATLERLKDALTPRDALVAALLFEDDGTMDEVAVALSIPMEELATTRERLLRKAASLGVAVEPSADNRRAP
jgi:DNA-directed RNA polymerase specialized sigma24 family protein